MYDPAHPFGRKRYSRAVIDPVSCTGCGYCTMFCVMDCIVPARSTVRLTR